MPKTRKEQWIENNLEHDGLPESDSYIVRGTSYVIAHNGSGHSIMRRDSRYPSWSDDAYSEISSHEGSLNPYVSSLSEAISSLANII